jgi:preprotein translocase subunit SecD
LIDDDCLLTARNDGVPYPAVRDLLKPRFFDPLSAMDLQARGRIMQRLRSLFIGVATLLVPAMQAKALTLEVKEAEVGEEHGKPAVYFVLTGQSARSFWEFSKMNLPKRVIFRVDGRDIMKIWIVQELSAGRGVLEVESVNEAVALAIRLNSGKATLEVEEDYSQ